MKKLNIFGIVLIVHVVFVGFVMMLQGCGTISTEPPPPVTVMPPTRPKLTPPRLPPFRDPTPSAPAPAPTPGKTYVVSKGDHLSGIAQKHGVTVKEIVALNGLKSANKIYVNQRLVLPAYARPGATRRSSRPSTAAPPEGGITYKVRKGDTLSQIAVSCGTTVRWLRDKNRLTSDVIFAGQSLVVPRLPKGTRPGTAPLTPVTPPRTASRPRTTARPPAPAPRITRPVARPPAPAPVREPEKPAWPANDADMNYIPHMVEIGENLDQIARLYGVSTERLKRFNKLSGDVNAGDIVKIPQED